MKELNKPKPTRSKSETLPPPPPNKKYKKCRHCKQFIKVGGVHGEKRWYGWVYSHTECEMNNFMGKVSKSPILLSKYISIYGS